MMGIIDHIRQPEYTGENRCIPCTAVNFVIAILISGVVALGSTLLGVGIFALSLKTIYLRGYLVPGTPTLTKRYLPEHILRWFDKDSTTAVIGDHTEIDPEKILININAVEPCRENTDLCLTAEFRKAWRKRIHTIRAHDPDENHLESALGISSEDSQTTFDHQGDSFLVYTDDTVIGQWSSRAAVLADVAAATELSERISNWSDFTPTEIARVLMSLRIFIEQCPDCGGQVQVEQEVVESCCRSYDVVASACQDCDARLFEMEWEDTDVDGPQTHPNQPEANT